VSPRLANLLDKGLVAVYGDEVGAALQNMVADLLDTLPLDAPVEETILQMKGIVTTLAGVAAGDQSCCKAFDGWIEAFQSFGDEAMQDTWSARVFEDFSQAADGTLTLLGNLIAGGASAFFSSSSGLFSDLFGWIADAIATVASWDESAADEVAKLLGLDDPSGGLLGLVETIWDDLTQGAVDLYEQVYDAMLDAFFAIPGVEQTYEVVDAARGLVDGVSWLYAHLGDPDIVAKSHDEMGNTFVPKLVDAGATIYHAMQSFAVAIEASAANLLTALGDAIDAATGIPIISGAVAGLTALRDSVAWVLDSPVWAESVQALSVFIDFSEQVLSTLIDVLVGLGGSLANPLVLLALLVGGILQLLSDDLDPDVQTIAQEAQKFFADMQSGAPDFSALAKMLGGLWETFVNAVQDTAKGLMDQLIEGQLLLEDAPYDLGKWLGWLAVVVFGEALLTKGAGLVATKLSWLGDALEAVVALLEAPDVVMEVIALPIEELGAAALEFVGEAGEFLRQLENPEIDAILEAIEDMAKKIGEWADWLEKKHGWEADKEEEISKHALKKAMDEGPQLIAGMVKVAEKLGNDDIDAIVQKAFMELVEKQEQSLPETAKKAVEKGLEAIVRNGTLVLKPEWYDPDKSPEENLVAYLVDVAKKRMRAAAAPGAPRPKPPDVPAGPAPRAVIERDQR